MPEKPIPEAGSKRIVPMLFGLALVGSIASALLLLRRTPDLLAGPQRSASVIRRGPPKRVQSLLPPARHEARDVHFGPMLIGFVLAALILAGIIFLPSWLFPQAAKDTTPGTPLRRFAEPHLQSNPRGDMTAFYAAEMQRLNGLGWIDEHEGTVHIPIDQAIREIAKDGIADWPKSAPKGAP